MKLNKQSSGRVTIPSKILKEFNCVAVQLQKYKNYTKITPLQKETSPCHKLTKSGSLEIREVWLPKGKKLKLVIKKKSLLLK